MYKERRLIICAVHLYLLILRGEGGADSPDGETKNAQQILV